MSQIPIEELSTEEVAANSGVPPKYDYSLEALVFLISKNRVHSLEMKTRDEFKQLKQRQDKVKYLHQLMKSVNKITDSKTGGCDFTSHADLVALFDEARAMGVEIEQGKLKYDREGRDRFIDNIRMTIDDFNVQNEMQLQTITRLTNERYESFQMARSIMKPLHDDKINKARAIAGR